MPLALPRFYPIIDRSIRAELPLDELARILTGAGVRLIQFRAKGMTSQALLAETQVLLSSLPASVSLIVNDRADVARLAGAAGVHVGQHDLPPAAARDLLGPDKIVGLSTHTLKQVEAAAAAPVDYLAFGPVFATTTKADAEPAVGCAALRRAGRQTRKPLVAIGGITPQNAAAALEAGADSVAVISGWMVPTKEGLAADDIPRRLEEFRRALGRLD